MFLCVQVLLKKVHPIRLAVVVILMGLASRLRFALFVGPLFAVAHFLVLLGGILVVFAFAVALVPIKLKKKKGSKVKKRQPVRGKKLYKLLLLVLLVRGCVLDLNFVYFPFLFYTDSVYTSLRWGKNIVALRLYLLVVIIAAADICKYQKGALIR